MSDVNEDQAYDLRERRVWTCKIGGRVGRLPGGADAPMRRAVADAFTAETGCPVEFCFSGWGDDLDESELAVVEDRAPDPEAIRAALVKRLTSLPPEPPAPVTGDDSEPPEVKRRTRREVTDDFIGGTRTIREWVNGGSVDGPRLCEELDAWLDYWGGWTPHRAAATVEPPAPVTGDDLRERIVKVIDDWHSTVEMWSELDDLADAVLAVLPAPPVPPWPGAVLSGLVDEDGQPTWLAQAGQVRGEQVRGSRNLQWVPNHGVYGPPVWVEVRAPRPAPATERVQAWEAVRDGRQVVGASSPFEAHYIWRSGPGRAFIGERTMDKAVLIAPDGTVEVLKGGDR